MPTVLRISIKTTVIASLAAGLILATLLAWHWGAERQVRLHQRHLLKAVEDRSWKKVAHFFSPDYRDSWGFDKPRALEAAEEIFRHFFALGVESAEENVSAAAGAGTVSTRLKLSGSGTAIAHEAIRRVNALDAPFTFHWRRPAWKPWHWELMSVAQPELDVGGEILFF